MAQKSQLRCQCFVHGALVGESERKLRSIKCQAIDDYTTATPPSQFWSSVTVRLLAYLANCGSPIIDNVKRIQDCEGAGVPSSARRLGSR